MTDNEIIKVFEDCIVKQRCDWQACLYYDFDHCEEDVAKDALSLINRQKAEIERLKELNADLVALADRRKKAAFSYLKGKMESDIALRTAKAEAIKEFAERLKGKAKPHYFDNCNFAVPVDVIDNLVKEMVGDA